ncbi:hypothetical protein HI914_06312 [Erysiphe necator]|nr:hypothetical protein HI914_06312 [Erysiphe necator]
MAHRVVDSHEATSNDSVYSGDGILQATTVVQVIVHVKLREGSKKLPLNDALYIPRYMINLISLKRLRSIYSMIL